MLWSSLSLVIMRYFNSFSVWLSAVWLQMWGIRKNVLNHCFPTQIFNVFRYWYVGGICLFKNTGRRENSSGTAAKSSNVDQVRIKKHLLFSLAKKKKGVCSGCLCFHVIFWIVCHVFELKFKEFRQGCEILFLTLLPICILLGGSSDLIPAFTGLHFWVWHLL